MAVVKYNNEEIVCGEYLIEEVELLGRGGLIIPKMIIPYNLINYLLKNNLINKSNILLFKKSSYSIKKEKLAEFAKYIKGKFNESIAKKLINCWIGDFGKKYYKNDMGFVTYDYDTVCASYNEKKKNEDWVMAELNELYFVRVTTKTRLFGDKVQINRQILGQGIIQLLELLKVALNEKSILVGYNTDSVFIENPNKVNVDENSIYKAESWKPKQFKSLFDDIDDEEFNEDDIKEIQPWTELNDIQFNGDEVICDIDNYIDQLKNKSMLITGGGGFQKTTLLTRLHSDNSVVFCYTNKACSEIRKAGIKEVYTFDSFFLFHDRMPENIKLIQVDEFSMIPSKWLVQLYKLKQRNPKLIIQMFGDPNQCKQVCELNRYFEYMNKKVVRELCDNNLMIKKYVDGCARYDNELKEVLDYLLEHKKLPESLNNENHKIDKTIKVNVMKNNKLNEKINKQFIKNNWTVGMKVVCNVNDKKNNLWNSKFYWIKSISGKKIQVIDIESEDQQVSEWISKSKFAPAYALTVYRYQGSKIDEPFNIRQANQMSLNEIYTALSRGTSLKNIHIEYTNKEFRKETEPTMVTEIELTKPSIGYIYLLSNDENNNIYVGETDNIERRFEEHTTKNDVIMQNGKNWKISKLTTVHYFKKQVLLNVETRYIGYYCNKNEYKMLNTQKVPKKETFKPNITNGTIDDRIKIEKYENFYRIRVRSNGKNIIIKKNFGNCRTEEQAYNEINDAKNKLQIDFFD